MWCRRIRVLRLLPFRAYIRFGCSMLFLHLRTYIHEDRGLGIRDRRNSKEFYRQPVKVDRSA